MLDFIAIPLGQFLYFIYNNISFLNYGLAIIIFTVIIRLLILPLTIRQYRSSARMQELGPQMQEIQKRYKTDKAKLNEEMMKFYQENKVNPAGGCLPLLIQMPILISLWYVITKPLTYMLQLPHNTIYGVMEKSTALKNGLVQIFNVPLNSYPEIKIVNQFSHDKVGAFLSPDVSSKITDLHNGLHFLGINLGEIPTWHINKIISDWHFAVLLILPILAVATTYISSKLTMPASAQPGQSNQMQKTMMLIAPLMTLYFSFMFPAGLSLYWTTGNLIQIGQQLVINKRVFKKKEVAIK